MKLLSKLTALSVGLLLVMPITQARAATADQVGPDVAILCFPLIYSDAEYRYDKMIINWCNELQRRLSEPSCRAGKVVNLLGKPADDTNGIKGYKSELADSKLREHSFVFVIGHGSPGPGAHTTGYLNTETVRNNVRSILPKASFHIGACYGNNGAGGRGENSSASAAGNEVGLCVAGPDTPSATYVPGLDASYIDYPTAALVKMLCDPKKYDTDRDNILSGREVREAMCRMTEAKSVTNTSQFITAQPLSTFQDAATVVDGEAGLQRALKDAKVHYDPNAKLEELDPTYTIEWQDGKNKRFYQRVSIPKGKTLKSYDPQWPAKCPVVAGFAYAHDCKVVQIAKRVNITVTYDTPYIPVAAVDASGQLTCLRVSAKVNSLSIPYTPPHDSLTARAPASSPHVIQTSH